MKKKRVVPKFIDMRSVGGFDEMVELIKPLQPIQVCETCGAPVLQIPPVFWDDVLFEANKSDGAFLGYLGICSNCHSFKQGYVCGLSLGQFADEVRARH